MTSTTPKPSPENCPEPFWHETHRYCPVCTWTEEPRPVYDSHFSLDGANCDVCTRESGKIVALENCERVKRLD